MGLGAGTASNRMAAVLETPPRVAAEPICVPARDVLVGTPVKETPVKETPVKGTPVKGTPVKTRAEPMGTPVKKRVSGMGTSSIVPMTPEKSIYEQLGWDDDDIGL